MFELDNVSKHYEARKQRVEAVTQVSLRVEEGDIFGIVGFSGAGKSSLIRMMNLLDRPSSGSVRLRGRDLTELSPAELREARQSVAMIFQHFNLISNKTVAANVSFPLEIARLPRAQRDARVRECLSIVGLLDKHDAWPATLSGGQKQRVAIARAMANRPSVLLCDEPTSALDPHSSREILDFLLKLNRELGVTIVIVTHQMSIVNEICNKVGVMEAGRLVETFALADRHHQPVTDIGRLLVRQRDTVIAAPAEARRAYA
ncbi:methionine ABC transporter ATP-binding protein [Caballeronia sp. LZ034LL]|uniref:methionine ABC transporter ATP-binding protein n=1 Tax=Caballeronia sp. LZ034LL TaxID=3038567 RepID=UPI002862C7D7|nr:methionine ABC transporter ATP-binding protein [Caballeronia sp. LZ034LL]MDR5836482.1 methionine ABC transporter ATP-binding protein [Caballeronia sp. LZ034LL]